ncbi:hypothetical protein RUM43_007666 [Polyplax serrata]|uniref:BZIP domain-containing protein n=1 Tax=Polyplax serrata TaxID=468196 RepID=A0AAN8S1V8_POLSC
MESQTAFPPSRDHHIPTFSALNLLRNYNQFICPTAGSNLVQVYHHYACGSSFGDFPCDNHLHPSFPLSPVVGAFHPYSQHPVPNSPTLSEVKSRPPLPLSTSPAYSKRARGEKKPIPDDQKDDRYYERRKRNNQAAKKSRDARKFREDQIALRATLLEHENAILRAQVLSLREEAQSLRRHVLEERKPSMPEKVIFPKALIREEDKIDQKRK